MSNVLVAIDITRDTWRLARYGLLEEAIRNGARTEIREALAEVNAILAQTRGEAGNLRFDLLTLIVRCCARSTDPEVRAARRTFAELQQAAVTAAEWETRGEGL